MTTATIAKLIRSCTEITMEAFIACLVDGRLDLLILEGEPSQDELADAWQDVYTEYTEAMGDTEHAEISKLLKDIAILNLQHRRITILITLLTTCYHPGAVAELKRLGYFIHYKPDDLPRYLRDLETAFNRSKTLLTKIAMLQSQLDEKQQAQQSKAASRGDFQTLLISISEFVKYQVVPGQISAYQFAVMVRRMREYSEKLEARMAKQKGGRAWQKN